MPTIFGVSGPSSSFFVLIQEVSHEKQCWDEHNRHCEEAVLFFFVSGGSVLLSRPF